MQVFMRLVALAFGLIAMDRNVQVLALGVIVAGKFLIPTSIVGSNQLARQ